MTLPIGQTADGQLVSFYLPMTNRHGLIAGATGTGKTMTLRHMAEQFSLAGVPVFLVDVKGDLSGFGLPGVLTDGLTQRLKQLNLPNVPFQAFPSVLWDAAGVLGHPIRTTVTEMGPQLLSRLLNLNDTQTAVLNQVFEVADDQGLSLLDVKDLKAVLNHVDDHAKTLANENGKLPSQSLAAIIRQLGSLASEADTFFGEPALNLTDLMQTDAEKGLIHVLNGQALMLQPALYATLLLWLLSELFEQLPEVGDADKPRLVLFFDEAHLLFSDMPDVLVDKMTQVVRLIRSKGVGLYFVTQNPMDIPEAVRGQLSNRVLHALRVFSPKEAKAVKTLADSFPMNAVLGDVADIIPNLGVGEALVSGLDANGQPQPAQRVLIHPACSLCGAITTAQRQDIQARFPAFNRYDQPVDAVSAYELLKQRVTASEAVRPANQPTEPAPQPRRANDDPWQAMLKSAVRAVGSELGRSLIRGVLGSTGRRGLFK
jgi:uncharacterized protein